MVLLADRNFAVKDLIAQIAGTRAQLLIRFRTDRKLPRIRGCRDGSWLSMLATLNHADSQMQS
jgi:hypothetical protein